MKNYRHDEHKPPLKHLSWYNIAVKKKTMKCTNVNNWSLPLRTRCYSPPADKNEKSSLQITSYMDNLKYFFLY